MTSRAALRKRVREQRRALSEAQRDECVALLSRRLFTHPLFQRSRHVAAYLPVDGEMDPQALMTRAGEMGKTIYLPVLVPVGHNRLWFAPWRPGEPLVDNLYGIPEPAAGRRTRVSPLRLDLVLMPLVAFDARGNRLGMGGGYYDRSFAFLRRHRNWRRPRLLGLAYEFQRQEALAARDWDVRLDGVATEAGLYFPDG